MAYSGVEQPGSSVGSYPTGHGFKSHLRNQMKEQFLKLKLKVREIFFGLVAPFIGPALLFVFGNTKHKVLALFIVILLLCTILYGLIKNQ